MKLFNLLLFLFLSLQLFAQTKVACVGNSITYGAGIEGRDSLAYPQQLGKILGESWVVKNFGNSGATMLKNGNKPYWSLPEFKKAKKFKPDVIIILLGTNDSKPINWEAHSNEYKKDFAEMIGIFQKLKSKPKIWLGIPPPAGENPWGISKEIVEGVITDQVRELAKDHDLGTINFFEGFEGQMELLPDNIHPNAKGAKVMAELAAKAIKN
ncbi:GDSL-type esterase/lipase family protein [Flexithrix dorotheae]|uniref:GDSL-type esterase/lipase family protein n=1 Tax=Flexithrix dorotheae TaxID=70993 RepID=UPI0007C4EC39|nr:GDSL-type esterase/lipase family protein [Flexithrix dorotheae]